MTRILILKTGALGDVLRTTSILPGLARRYPRARITWVTASDARELVARHPLVDEVRIVRLDDQAGIAELGDDLAASRWARVLSFDDELPMCRLAARVDGGGVSGAFLDDQGRRTYTDDVEDWFGMGLLARDGRAAADRRKRENRRSHAELFASMLGIEQGEPELPLDAERIAAAAELLGAEARRQRGPLIGLNTGAGGRWPTKAVPVERVVELTARLHDAHAGAVSFALFGGPDEVNRNEEILLGVEALPQRPDVIDTGVENPLLDFAAQIANCDLLVTSDSLGMHIALARRVPVVAFFAPTSAAEIAIGDPGEKVVSTAPDYCSYRTDADNSTITARRLADAVLRVLQGGRGEWRAAQGG